MNNIIATIITFILALGWLRLMDFLAHKGVIEIRNYRNPLEVTPHVAITIDFGTLDNWRDFIDSADYVRIMRELRILGCNNFTANVWAPSKYFPESMKP